MIVITDRYKEFLQECARPESPSIQPVPGALRRGQAVVAVIIFTGCRAEKDKCKSSVDFRVLKPDGSTYAEQRDLVLWDGSPPSGRQLLLSRANLGIRIEPTDPAGEYRVRALVFDHIAGVQLTLESRFSVAP